MLITCIECGLQVSDKAVTCPHCGYPLRPEKVEKRGKAKRLPNGFGQITKIKDRNLRNPYRVMVTVGKNAEGRPIQKLLKPKAYYKTYNEAYSALVEYNKAPYYLDKVSFEDLYERWSTSYFKSLKSESIRNIEAMWKHCEPVYDVDIRDMRPVYLKEFIVNLNTTSVVKARIKSIFNLMFDYAVEYELVPVNYAKMFQLPKEIVSDARTNVKDHQSISEENITLLWTHADEPRVKEILIQIYMGWRPQELFTIRTDCVDLENGFITGGMKTENGKDRRVPIHSKIEGLVKWFYKDALKYNREYLFEEVSEKSKLNYHRYRYDFMKLMREYNLPEYRPHDPRKTFVTLAKKYNVDEFAIKKIVGHSIKDLTERVYTDREDSWLKEEIEKIK